MGKKLFGIDVQKLVADAFKPKDTQKFILRKKSYAGYDPANPTSGRVETQVDYPCNGMVTSYSRFIFAQDDLIEDGDMRAVVVGRPLALQGVEPTKDDLFVDDEGTVYTIVKSDTTGLRATYILQIRGITQR
jgi:hypothetical protein